MIIIDAADNAQVEADDSKDDAFPKLLLSSLSENSIDGVKLVLTVRTHRMARVVDRSTVTPFALRPFTQNETEAYLSSRRANITSGEFATAFSRSSGNARVLAYLVDTWDSNVVGNTDKSEITVDQLIAEKCDKIFCDLRIAGWPDSDVQEFFSAISLLPPPMPLDELATALEWKKSQVASAASDLAPMLEIVPTHGAIFRDEPTETYVRDKYSYHTASQQAIAQRLQDAQVSSQYAAEALPGFLVAIKDGARAYALADSTQFPTSIQSDFGRRRLTLARLKMLGRTVGFGFAKLLRQHAPSISDSEADEVIDVLSRPRFLLREKASVLSLIAGKDRLHSRAGALAQSMVDEIRKDDQTDQRGDDYAALAEALLEMSVPEARLYYRNGLAELDKLGSGDYDLIYAILHYAAAQPGGCIRPELGHRLMNLSQTIITHDSHKFGWSLFGTACANLSELRPQPS